MALFLFFACSMLSVETSRSLLTPISCAVCVDDDYRPAVFQRGSDSPPNNSLFAVFIVNQRVGGLRRGTYYDVRAV